MVKLEVDKSGKAIIYKNEVHFLPAALIPFFIMSAGKTVEIKVDPSGPFTCLLMSIHKGKVSMVFELNKSRFRVCSDIAHQALDNYEVGKTYHLAVKECKEPGRIIGLGTRKALPGSPGKKPEVKKGKKDGK